VQAKKRNMGAQDLKKKNCIILSKRNVTVGERGLKLNKKSLNAFIKNK
jgi:hypothetical protein